MTVNQSEVSQGEDTLRTTPPPSELLDLWDETILASVLPPLPKEPLEPESESELEESELESEMCEAETTGEQEIMPPYALRSCSPVKDQPWVMHVQIPDDYLRLLSSRIEMNFPMFNKSLPIIAEMENAIRKLPGKKEDKAKLRTAMSKDLMRFKVKADKSHQLVVLKQEELLSNKIEIVSSDEYELLQRNPVEEIKSNLTKLLKKYKNEFTAKQIKNILDFNYVREPKLNIRIKTHKPENSCRPLVDFKKTVLYNLECFLKIFLQIIEKSIYSIQNTDDLINGLLKSKFKKTYRIMSLDIKSMYPSITLEMIKESLNINKVPEYIIKLIDFTFNNNYFKMSTDYYRQKEGIAMGSVIKPKLADITMKIMDEKISKFKGIQYYARYVDDILIVYDSKIVTCKDIKDHANSLYRNLKFTSEDELKQEMKFLDIVIKRKETRVLFSKYEKPCNIKKTINYKSYCPIDTKRNVFVMELKRS
ncbi:uncharacterized protein [Centruroides vittatus]|uniref:uncharacterized protein n=1 Tax=Centruroides vittatus TaxID=120091 RepID=UPI00350F9679